MGANAAVNSKFDNVVKMWVFEEMVNGRKLTEIINTEHENVKYLPGHKLPSNVVSNYFDCLLSCWHCPLFLCLMAMVLKPTHKHKQTANSDVFQMYFCNDTRVVNCRRILLCPPQLAVPDLVDAASDADILVFVIPHQFIGKVCDTMKDKIKSDAVGISLIKVKSLVLAVSLFCLSFPYLFIL